MKLIKPSKPLILLRCGWNCVKFMLPIGTVPMDNTWDTLLLCDCSGHKTAEAAAVKK